MSELWRLIVEPPLRGARNMAVDEAILRAAAVGAVLPTLRLYRWQPTCLSLGYAQPLSDVDLIRLQACGWDVVRRLTGGRAILHAQELTYSLSLPAAHLLAQGTILESYQRISAALLRAVEIMGLNGDALPHPEAEEQGAIKAICFEVPSSYEISAQGKKLIGSAQARKMGGLIQHGSLPLEGDLSLICDVLKFSTEGAREAARQRVKARAITAQAVNGQRVRWEQAAEAFAQSFADCFGVRFAPGQITPEESQTAALLERDQYGSIQWTGKF